MEIYQLKVFLEVAHCLSFTEAAYNLNLTQPAITAKIKSLESELNTPLFNRLRRKIELTEVGKILVNESVKIIELEAEVINKIEEFKQGGFGTIKIGAYSAIADHWLSYFLYKYRKEYPGIQTQLQTFSSSESLAKSLTNQDIDVGFSIISFKENSNLIDIKIDTVNYYIFVHKQHKLADKKWLSLRELLNYQWVIGSENFSSRLMWESRLSELGIKFSDFKQLEIVDTLGLMKTYLTQGNYIGFASDLELPSYEGSNLVAIPIQEFPLKANLFMLIPKYYEPYLAVEYKSKTKTSKESTPIEKFISLLLNVFQEKESKKSEVKDSFTLNPKLKQPRLNLLQKSTNKPEKIAIRIGTQNQTISTVTAGLIPQKLGLIEHFLPRSKRYHSVEYDLQLIDFSMGQPIVEGLHNNELDIGILGDYPLLQSAKTIGSSGQTILVSFVAINPEGTGNAIVVPQKSQIKTLEDLQGKFIELPFGSSAHGMVLRALKHFDLLADVNLYPMNQSMTKTVNPKKDTSSIYAHFSPFHELAHFQDKYQYLLNGNLSGLPSFSGIVVRKEFAETYPEIVISYLQAIIGAQYWYLNTPSAFSLISQWTNISPEILSRILSSTYQKECSNLFIPELNVRQDWIQSHIDQLQSIPNHEYLEDISLQNWIQTDFIHAAATMN